MRRWIRLFDCRGSTKLQAVPYFMMIPKMNVVFKETKGKGLMIIQMEELI